MKLTALGWNRNVAEPDVLSKKRQSGSRHSSFGRFEEIKGIVRSVEAPQRKFGEV